MGIMTRFLGQKIKIRFLKREVKKQPVEGYRNGAKGSKSVDEMSQQDLFKTLNQLNSEFKEFEKIREGISTRISLIAKLVPKLNERKEFLEKDIDKNLKGIQQLNLQVPTLNEEKENLLQSIRQTQEQKAFLENQIHLEQEKVSEVTGQITKLTNERLKIEKICRQKEEDVSKLKEHLIQIKSIQEYDVGFVSTLVYASKKSKS